MKIFADPIASKLETTPSVFAAPPDAANPASPELSGNCAYPNVPAIPPPNLTVHIFIYCVGSHWVVVFIVSTDAFVLKEAVP